MKFIGASIIIAIVLAAYSHQIDREEQSFQWHSAFEDCIPEVGVEIETIQRYRNDEIEADDKIKEFYLCTLQKIKTIDDDGKLDIETVKNRLKIRGLNETQIEEFVKNCAVQRDTALETAIHYSKCWRKTILPLK